MQIQLQGLLATILSPKTTKRGQVWPFVLQMPPEGNGRAQCYLVSAFSDINGDDPFRLDKHTGRQVRVKCYFNGNEYTGKNGPAYINELKLISIEAL